MTSYSSETALRLAKTAGLKDRADEIIESAFHMGYVYGVRVGRGERSEADMKRDAAAMKLEPDNRTRADVLREMFPHVDMKYPGNYPSVCVRYIGQLFGHRKVATCTEYSRCVDCWMVPYDGEFEVSCP